MEKTFDEKLAEAKAAVASISADEANTILQQNDAVFIDPRDEEDIPGTGIIPSALNIRLQDLEEKAPEQLSAELGDTERRIITACGMGPMGALAAHSLKRRGYRNVSFIEGGTQGWVEAGYPTR
jgi:rhodanese-related sulfurtransferase